MTCCEIIHPTKVAKLESLASLGADAMPVTLAQAKLHLRVDHSDEDSKIQGLIYAATGNAETFCRRAIPNQTIVATFPRFPTSNYCPLVLPWPTMQAVTALAYIDASGVTQEDTFEYYDTEISGPQWNHILPSYGVNWPVARCQPNAITVTYTAGYPTVSVVPWEISEAILHIIGSLYGLREDQVVGTSATEIPNVAARLLYSHRVMSYP